MPESDTRAEGARATSRGRVPGAVIARFEAALLEAYPSRNALSQMVRVGLDKNLAAISEADALAAVVHALVEWAEAGDLERLLDAAVAGNPNNAALEEAVVAVRAAPRVEVTGPADENDRGGKRPRPLPWTLALVAAGVVVAAVVGVVVWRRMHPPLKVPIAPGWTCRYRVLEGGQRGSAVCKSFRPQKDWPAAAMRIYELRWQGTTSPPRTSVVLREEPGVTLHRFHPCAGDATPLCMAVEGVGELTLPLSRTCGADGQYRFLVTRCSVREGDLAEPQLFLEGRDDATLRTVRGCVRVDDRDGGLPCR